MKKNEGKLICLIHSELSEALECLRAGNKPDKHLPESNGVEVELAGTVIRIMDYAAAKKYGVSEALVTKVDFNKTRAYKHGGKAL